MTDAPAERKAMTVRRDQLGTIQPEGRLTPEETYTLPTWPRGTYPKADMAHDWSGDVSGMLAWGMDSGRLHEGLGFLGYPYLSELTQRGEYRRPSEVLANEMTRKWIKVTAKGDADKTNRVKVLEDALKRYDIQRLMRRALELDGFMGRAQIFVTVKGVTTGETLQDPLIADPAGRTVGIGDKLGFQLVEPMWVAPGTFNATNPLDPGFYRPTEWYVMGQRVHASRLLTIVSREVPDILKPLYGFGGLSLSQMAKPYVDNWLRTRQSVSDLLHSFSTMILATDLSAALEGGGMDTMLARAEMYNLMRDNRGLFVVNKDSEELTNVSTPLGTLDALQAQSQEHMASVTAIPLVILLGITPSGLNASADGEIRVFYGWVQSQQEKVIRPALTTIVKLLQLTEWGEVDPDIDFDFLSLWEEDEGDMATNRKTDADTDGVLIMNGVIMPEEARQRLADNEDSPYHGLDMSVEVTPPMQPGDEEDPDAEEGDGDGDGGGPPPGLAQDDRWITVKPHGPDEKGQPVKLNDDGTVIGGAGGKLDGRKLGGGGGKGGGGEGDKDHKTLGSEAEALSASAKTKEEHGAAAKAHHKAMNAALKAGDTEAANAHQRKFIEHFDRQLDDDDETPPAPAPPPPATPMGPKPGAGPSALTQREKDFAAARKQADLDSEHANANLDDHNAQIDAHDQHKAAAQLANTSDEMHYHNSKAEDHAERASVLFRDRAKQRADQAKTADDFDKAAAEYEKAAYWADKAGIGGLGLRTMASTQRMKGELLRQAQQASASVEGFHASEHGQRAAKVEKTFAKHTPDQIHQHFVSNYGLPVRNGTTGNALKDYKKATKAYYANWSNQNDQEREEARNNMIELRKNLAQSLNGVVSGMNEIDLTKNTAGAKAARKVLGHVDASFQQMMAQGFDIKAALAHANVKYHPATAVGSKKSGPPNGTAWPRKMEQHGGNFSVNTTTVDPEKRVQQLAVAANRAQHNMSRWSVSGGDPMVTARHELAHAIGMQPHINSPAKLQAILHQLIPGGAPAQRDWITKNISEYAASEIVETDAELAAMVTDPSYVRGTLPKVLEDHVDALFHKKDTQNA